jgi:choice-of-anchor B domain-containing protein
MRLLLLMLPLLHFVTPAGACPIPAGDPGAASLSAVQQAHPDGQKEADNQDPYTGNGWRESEGGAPDVTFSSSGVTLRSWITLDEFDPAATDGNDCWGYTAPSGREYALIGLNNGTGVVEVTDPGDAQIVAHLPGIASIWRDIKTYSHYVYAVSEGGGGIQVFDVSQIDSGVIVDKGSVTTGGGTLASHNVAINEQSARLYRVGGGGTPIEGLRIYSLANPEVPAFLGSWNDRYCHDAQIVTWTRAPYVGVEVAFCFANNTASSGAPGVEILDVTDPQNISVIGAIDLTQAPIFSHPASYSHQGWLSKNRRYLYFDDEVDESATGNPTLTRVIDVQDLSNPIQVASFSNTTAARDHNLYTVGPRLFQANYRSGLRVLDATLPLALAEIGYFDTYPPDDNANYNGLWSVYPFFPSQTIIGSDIEKGLFVWTVDAKAVPSLPLPGFGVLALLFAGVGVAALGASRRARVRV